MIQSQRTTVSIEQAQISTIYGSVHKIKVLTHCFERSEGGEFDDRPIILPGKKKDAQQKYTCVLEGVSL